MKNPSTLSKINGYSVWCVLGAVLCFSRPTCVFAQDDSTQSDSQTATAERQQSQKEQTEREKSQAALRDFLNNPNRYRRMSAGAMAGLEARFLEFRLAIPKFRTATDDYRWALSLDNKLDKPLKGLESQTDVLLRYLDTAKIKHERPDSSEFKDYSSNELAWETLNTAERIAAFLDLAVEVEQQAVVEAKTLEFLYTLDGELLRLKWLTAHTKS